MGRVWFLRPILRLAWAIISCQLIPRPVLQELQGAKARSELDAKQRDTDRVEQDAKVTEQLMALRNEQTQALESLRIGVCV